MSYALFFFLGLMPMPAAIWFLDFLRVFFGLVVAICKTLNYQ